MRAEAHDASVFNDRLGNLGLYLPDRQPFDHVFP